MLLSKYPFHVHTKLCSPYGATIIFGISRFIANISVRFLSENGKLGLFIQNFMQNGMVVSEFSSTARVYKLVCAHYTKVNLRARD
jgi:hypothetical protein